MSVPALKQEPPSGGDIIEQVIVQGDLDKLSPEDRARYYMRVCDSIGVNPLTTPFAYLKLNGKLQLYALRSCTDQLRTIHGVSVEDMSESEREGVYIVTTKVRNKEGRHDIAKGAVPIANLRGEALANAMMKAETKSKRRATLSICGLGWLDESEVETIPGAHVVEPPSPTLMQSALDPQEVKPPPPHDPETGELGPRALPLPEGPTEFDQNRQWCAQLLMAVNMSKTVAELDQWMTSNREMLAVIKRANPKSYDILRSKALSARDALKAKAEPDIPDFLDRRGGPTPEQPEDWLAHIRETLKLCPTPEQVHAEWLKKFMPKLSEMLEPDAAIARGIYQDNMARFT